MIKNPFFIGDIPIPFEIILKEKNNLSLFEGEVKKRLNIPIEEGGYKFQDAHIQLGSKIHIKDFYYVERLFQNSYYAVRFAYLVSEYIFNQLKESPEENNNITILGYGLYSELLVSNTARFLNKLFNTYKFNHCIVEDVEGLSILNGYNLNQKIILIIPIASTLTTQIKIWKKLSTLKRGQEDYRFDNPPKLILNPISIIVVGHDEIDKITDARGEVIKPVVKKFWEKLDIKNRVITLSNIPFENITNLTRTHYFIYMPSEWNLSHECKYCWGKTSKPLFYTDKVSVSPKTIFDLPQKKEKEGPSFTIFGPRNRKEKEQKQVVITPDMVQYGHYERGMNHYLFYIDSNKFFRKNKSGIKKWLNDVRKALEMYVKGNSLEQRPCIIIAPSHESNVDFVNLVNEQIFNDSAHIFYYDPTSEDKQNLRLFLKRILSTDPLVFFVDDALCTGKTLYHTKIILSSLNKNLTASFTMINRLPNDIYEAIKYEGEKIYSFCYLEAPVATAIGDKCHMCNEKKRYEKILSYTSIDALRRRVKTKIINKLEPKDIRKTNNVQRKKRHFIRLKLTHRLFHKFSDVITDALEKENIIESIHVNPHYSTITNNFEKEDIIESMLDKMVSKIASKKNHSDWNSTSKTQTEEEKIESKEIWMNLLKTLSLPPFIYYRKIREKIYSLLIKETNKILEKGNLEDIQYLTMLLKRLAFLGCPELLKNKGFLGKIKAIFEHSVFKTGEIKNLPIYKDWAELKTQIAAYQSTPKTNDQPQLSLFPENKKNTKLIESIKNFCIRYSIEEYEEYLKDIKKLDNEVENRINEIRNLGVTYALSVKEVIVPDEAKSFKLEQELDNLLENTKTGAFKDLLQILYIENDVIIKNAINYLTQIASYKVGKINKLDEVKEIIEKLPYYEKILHIIRTDYRFSYLRYLINYKREGEKSNKNSDKLVENFHMERWYKGTVAPLLSLSLLLKLVKHDKITQGNVEILSHTSLLSKTIEYILEFLLKIARIEPGEGGTFLAVKRGFATSDKIEDLYIVGKLGKNIEYLDEHITDKNNSWTIKVFNGIKVSNNGTPWTIVERHNTDNYRKWYNAQIKFEDLFEVKKLKEFNHFLFIRITDTRENDTKLIPNGVLVLYKNNPFTIEEQRNVLLLKNELNEFLERHYENYSFEEWIRKHEETLSITQNIEKYRHGESRYSKALVNIIRYIKSQKKFSSDKIYALRFQARIIKFKWAIGHYYALITNTKDKTDLKGHILGETRAHIFFQEFEQNLNEIMEISNKYVGKLTYPNISDFDFHIDDKLTKQASFPSKVIKFKIDVFKAIMWEFLLNHLRHGGNSKFFINYIPKEKGICIKKGPKGKNTSKDTEGFKIGLPTIAGLINLVGGEFVEEQDGFYLKNILSKKSPLEEAR